MKSNVNTVSKGDRLLATLAALANPHRMRVVAALAGGAMWWLTRLGTDRAVTRALSSSEARTLQAANGQTGNLTLDDSTKVTLAPGSKRCCCKPQPG